MNDEGRNGEDECAVLNKEEVRELFSSGKTKACLVANECLKRTAVKVPRWKISEPINQ